MRVAVKKGAKRSKRRKKSGDQRDQGTHLPWFVSLCECECIQTVMYYVFWFVFVTMRNLSVGVLYPYHTWNRQVHVFVEIIGYDCWDRADSCCCGVMVKLQASWERLHSNLSLPVLFCPSWTLCRRKSSRRSREPSTSSPWAQVCPRPCSRPRNTHTVFGRHSLSPDWVRSYYSSIICIIFFCIMYLHI